MNKINLYNQSFKINGECFLTIIIENKCNYKNIIDFLNKANEHLNVPLSLESD